MLTKGAHNNHLQPTNLTRTHTHNRATSPEPNEPAEPTEPRGRHCTRYCSGHLLYVPEPWSPGVFLPVLYRSTGTRGLTVGLRGGCGHPWVTPASPQGAAPRRMRSGGNATCIAIAVAGALLIHLFRLIAWPNNGAGSWPLGLSSRADPAEPPRPAPTPPTSPPPLPIEEQPPATVVPPLYRQFPDVPSLLPSLLQDLD